MVTWCGDTKLLTHSLTHSHTHTHTHKLTLSHLLTHSHSSYSSLGRAYRLYANYALVSQQLEGWAIIIWPIIGPHKKKPTGQLITTSPPSQFLYFVLIFSCHHHIQFIINYTLSTVVQSVYTQHTTHNIMCTLQYSNIQIVRGRGRRPTFFKKAFTDLPTMLLHRTGPPIGQWPTRLQIRCRPIRF